VIERDGDRQQIVCDTCPKALPPYATEDFRAMIADVKAAGWVIAQARPANDCDTRELFGSAPRIAGNAKAQPYTHACPDCTRKPAAAQRSLL
jgi:hypothetical protein